MPRRILDRIRAAVRKTEYDMTAHAVGGMADDELDSIDIETSVLNGLLIRTEKDDPRGTRYTLQGTALDRTTLVRTVGRFTETGRYLVITVYVVREREP
jgi:hypothetical protein